MHVEHGFLDTFEVRRQLADQVHEVGVSVKHPIPGRGGHGAATGDAVAPDLQLADLRAQSIDTILSIDMSQSAGLSTRE
nr:hypothetical protein [Catenulispora rubra]